MNSGLRELWGLPEAKPNGANGQGDNLGRAFREGMSRVNRDMQAAAASAGRTEFQLLDTQRQRLCEAFQKVSKNGAGDAAGASQGMQRVIAALGIVEGKASKLAAGASAGRDEWLKREPDFDVTMDRIRELEEADHPKVATLRKLSDVIRDRVNSHDYKTSVTAFDQLRPKLDSIYAQHQAGASAPGGAAAPPTQRRPMPFPRAEGGPILPSPPPAETPSKSPSNQELQVLEDRRRDFKKARAAWVAAKTKAEGDLEKVKEGARQEYMADAGQFPKIVQGCKGIDDILDNLDDELRDTLDQYVSTPIKNQTKLVSLAAEATEILDRYLNFVADNTLMKAIDMKEFADVTIHAPVMKALGDLKKALS